MRRPLLAALAGLAVLAGCGGGGDALSKEDYEQELAGAAADLTQASQTLATELSSAMAGDGGFDQAAEDLRAVRDQLDETAGQLDDLDPPEDAVEAHDRLVDALRAYSDDLEDVQGALEEGSEAAIAESLAGLEGLESVDDLRRAGSELEKLGYTFET